MDNLPVSLLNSINNWKECLIENDQDDEEKPAYKVTLSSYSGR